MLIPPQKPTQIPLESIITDIDDQLDTLMVNWGPPVHTNGDLTSYEVCLGENELEREEDCDGIFRDAVSMPPLIFSVEAFQIIKTNQMNVQVHTCIHSSGVKHAMLLLCEDFDIAEKCRT